MTRLHVNSTSYRGWLLLFFLYNLAFLAVQFGFILSQSSSFLHTLHLPWQVYLELLATAFIHIGLYSLLSLIQTAVFWGMGQYSLVRMSLMRWHLALWLLSCCVILSANAYFFPLSIFSRLLLPPLPPSIWFVFLVISMIILGGLALNALFFAARRFPSSVSVLLISFGLCSYFLIITPTLIHPEKLKYHTRPNIILIGIDSLSPSSINASDTPSLANFIQKSVLFKNTVSPLARTYPAWVSILTGLYPHHHGGRYNLMPPHLVKHSESIVWDLKKQGYFAFFATDDRRFNSIGPEFGFQKIIGPKLGVNDILLGTFNDFPLGNLLFNFPLGRGLFPYNHLNRASYFSYYPQTFDKALKHQLVATHQISPQFIAVHFALPHWPYAWASSLPSEVKDEFSVEKKEQLYLSALRQVDKEVAFFLHQLQQYGYLKNSLVILLSDHGEALYTPGSREISAATYQRKGISKLADYFKNQTSTALDMSAGHGSDLLSSAQYQCVLAFQIYKNNQLATSPKIIDTRVSLIDIAPTILAFLEKKYQQMDGISLLNTIYDKNFPLSKRAFIMESGMLPNQFLSRDRAKKLAKLFFTVTPNGQLQIRENALVTLDAMKLYGIIQENWLLVLYPTKAGYIPVILHLGTQQWSDVLTEDFASSSPARQMLEQLRHFYNSAKDKTQHFPIVRTGPQVR